MTLRFDSASTLRLALLARKVDGRPAPLARFERDYSALLNELSIRRMVRIEHDGETIGTLNVGGGAEAVAAVLACQARHEGFASPSSPAPAPAQAPTPPRAAPASPPALPSTRPPSSPPMREAPPPGETSPSTR